VYVTLALPSRGRPHFIVMAVMVVSLETPLFIAFSFGRMLRTIRTVFCVRGQDRRCVECMSVRLQTWLGKAEVTDVRRE
jgi:hypothetical protein